MDILEYTSDENLEQMIVALPLDSVLYVANVPNESYHASKGVSSTGAKTAFQSEQRYWRYITAPQEKRKEHYVFGELAHDSIRLPPDEIKDLYCSSVSFVSGQRNLGKAQRKVVNEGADVQEVLSQINLKPEERPQLLEFVEKVGGRQVVNRTQLSEARQIANMIHEHPIVSSMLEKQDHYFELSVWRRDPDGFLRKARPDVYFPEAQVVFDWKTVRDLIWKYDTDDRMIFVKQNLERVIDKLGYAFSGAWYLNVLGILETGAFMLFFADKDALEIYPPWVPSTESMEQQWRHCQAAIKSIKSVRKKTSDGKVIEPLEQFIPLGNDVFSGQTKEFI